MQFRLPLPLLLSLRPEDEGVIVHGAAVGRIMVTGEEGGESATLEAASFR